ncbi:hypothetical protein QVD17_18309 [Tagetes erecta]|uniref:Uncharacterized protein n=1 Tax=Tagetes erecta TaxID=13708 RepID=A0AAD8NW83_TARER|nr:hypothetical protein QVD17_18309 [Tagetes erecta]
MCDCFFLHFTSKPKLKCETDPQKAPLITNTDDHDQLHNPTMAMALVLTSWLQGRRLRYLILALCLPVLIPIVFVSIPVICVVEICFCFCCHRRKRLTLGPVEDVERGGEMEVNLLERYLDDQLELVLDIVCECECGAGVESDEFFYNGSDLLC